MRHALLFAASITAGTACAVAAEPLTDAVVYATDDPRVFELRLPESILAPEGLPQVRLANYLCAESGNCESGCPVCNRQTQEKWSTSIDYLLFYADNAYGYSSPSDSRDAIAHGVRFQAEKEATDGFGWRVRYEWFGDERDAYQSFSQRYVSQEFSGQRLGLDLYQRFAVGRTQFRVGIGPALARARHSSRYTFASYLSEDDGIGVGTFIDFSRVVGRIGRTDFALTGGIGNDYLATGEGSLWIRQINLGLEARREFDHGSLILQTGYEHQNWSSLPQVNGASLRLGYTW